MHRRSLGQCSMKNIPPRTIKLEASNSSLDATTTSIPPDYHQQALKHPPWPASSPLVSVVAGPRLRPRQRPYLPTPSLAGASRRKTLARKPRTLASATAAPCFCIPTPPSISQASCTRKLQACRPVTSNPPSEKPVYAYRLPRCILQRRDIENHLCLRNACTAIATENRTPTVGPPRYFQRTQILALT
ncbi:hypothetical protein LY76DRAFT_1836 [Colletotrichum caudatum]|nr:hypothetical protein LY76DRAFT_1836 [Colletotrichum caudatum]